MSAEIARTIQINGQEMGFRDIHKQISKTPYGEELKSKVRWSRYKPDNMENEEWQSLLGYDVNNFDHSRLVHKITMWFMKRMNQSVCNISFDTEEQKIMGFVAENHDLPESKTGDKMFDLKTKNDEKEELNNVLEIFIDLFKNDGYRLAEMTKSILTDKKSKLSMAFNAIETVGYFRTGLKAWKRSEKTNDEELSLKHLKWLTSNCFGNNISRIIKYSEIYPPVKTYLERNKNLICEIFNKMPLISFEQYSTEEEKIIQKEKFEKARLEWNSYLLSNNK